MTGNRAIAPIRSCRTFTTKMTRGTTTDLRKMVLEKMAEKKKQEEDVLRKLREEKKKQDERHHQWRIFMHSRKELAEMKKWEKQEKARKKVEDVKRKLIFEKEEKEKEEKKKEEQRRQEKQKMRDEAEKKRKQKTPTKRPWMEEITLFSSDDEIPAKRGRLFTIYLLCLKSDSVESLELIKVSPDVAQYPSNISLYKKYDSVESFE